MLLPNADYAEIDPAKLHGYLLSSIHPIGRFKARFFAALGYTADEWQVLEANLRIQHLSQEAVPGLRMPYRPVVHDPGYPQGTERRGGGGRHCLVHPFRQRRAALRDRVSRRRPVTLRPLDVVVLTHDIPADGLRTGDLGTVVEVYAPDAIAVEFVAASGRTQAVITLSPADMREVEDNDLVSVRPVRSSQSQRDA